MATTWRSRLCCFTPSHKVGYTLVARHAGGSHSWPSGPSMQWVTEPSRCSANSDWSMAASVVAWSLTRIHEQSCDVMQSVPRRERPSCQRQNAGITFDDCIERLAPGRLCCML
ncbi:hypothetical protein HBH82_132300 [Parastagonospora nodorum]|nr:hypothetical protein HBI09_073350 [Parastagonospora nodorum]KAH4604268.1 hypothetical protein HBH82_132300 [Parastagonospora nodorum]KAH4690665.1 hypothetical protein HBH78_090520 [Parastagonospora nodorum]KAH4705468.1 hypothetical protein HBH67_090570 [Parastagonospora nodorum]KAH4780506.1 hypothetical protein HBH62_130130 [Parastagonospora nodorum]